MGGVFRVVKISGLTVAALLSCSVGVARQACACTTKGMAYVLAMRSDLRSLASAQEAYHARRAAFAPDLNALGAGFRASAGVEVVIEHADSAGWRARATHASRAGVCTVGAPARDGITCDPDIAALRRRERNWARGFFAVAGALWVLVVWETRRARKR